MRYISFFIVLLSLCLFLPVLSLYEPTKEDGAILVAVQKKLQKMYETDPDRVATLRIRIGDLSIDEETRLGFLLQKA